MLIVSILIAIVLFAAATAQAKLVIDFNNPNLEKLRIAIPDLVADQPSSLNGAALAEIIRNDLTLTGLFHIVRMPLADTPNPASEPDFRQLSDMGVRAL
ncbi:MAG: hypothetical protein FJY85_12365, partial [Deltaproteobacteria bacterium]|nr:hypothetical protein [Deltaproteobacteria bacterium]